MWVAESQYEVLGTRFGVRCDDLAVAERVEILLEPFRRHTIRPVRARNLFALTSHRRGDDRRYAFRDCRRIARSESWTEVLDGVLAEVNRRAIDEMAYFGVHAGVVAVASKTIAFPAASGAGKSTLVAACVKAGFEYVSDEALCLDYSTGSVIPYLKALNLSRWSIEELALDFPDDLTSDLTKTPIPADRLGAVAAGDPRKLSDVVFAERRPGKPNLVEISPSQVIAGLLRYSFNHFRRPEDAFVLTTELARHSQGWKLEYENPNDAAELMLSASV